MDIANKKARGYPSLGSYPWYKPLSRNEERAWEIIQMKWLTPCWQHKTARSWLCRWGCDSKAPGSYSNMNLAMLTPESCLSPRYRALRQHGVEKQHQKLGSKICAYFTWSWLPSFQEMCNAILQGILIDWNFPDKFILSSLTHASLQAYIFNENITIKYLKECTVSWNMLDKAVLIRASFLISGTWGCYASISRL